MGAQGIAPPPAFHPVPGPSPMSHYDVIIIGSGAGGGTPFPPLGPFGTASRPAAAGATLAPRPAPSGKRVLLLGRGDYVPREPDNWSTRAVNVEGKYQTKEHWRDKDGKDLHPHPNYWVAATPSSTAPRCFGSGGRTSASLGTTAASRRRGP